MEKEKKKGLLGATREGMRGAEGRMSIEGLQDRTEKTLRWR